MILAHFAADCKTQSKRCKGYYGKDYFFFLITIFKISELTYSGRVDIKSSNAFSLDSLPLFVKARRSQEEWELPHIPYEGEGSPSAGQ